MKWNRKWKIPHTVSESQIKSKTVMSWSSRKKKEHIFCAAYSVRMNFFEHLCFIYMYKVLNKLAAEHTYTYISKNINCYTYLLVF